jgi:hypothetical protein
MSVLVVLILIAAVVTFFILRAGEVRRFETSADPHRVIIAVVGIVGARRSWQTLSQTDHHVSFRYHKGPNMLITLILLLCLLVPGIVYILLAGKRESLIVNIDSATNGMTVVQVTSNGYRGKGAGRELHRRISLPAGSLGAGTTPAPAR